MRDLPASRQDYLRGLSVMQYRFYLNAMVILTGEDEKVNPPKFSDIYY